MKGMLSTLIFFSVISFLSAQDDKKNIETQQKPKNAAGEDLGEFKKLKEDSTISALKNIFGKKSSMPIATPGKNLKYNMPVFKPDSTTRYNMPVYGEPGNTTTRFKNLFKPEKDSSMQNQKRKK